MNYELCIESETGKINIKDETIIKKIDFKIFQNDKSANDRSDQLFNTLTVQGILTDKSQNETKEILEWSKKTDKANVYKTVSIKVYNQKELLRDYYLKDMFCTGYQEVFNELDDQVDSDSIGMFVLEMKQRKGSINTINVEC